MEKKYQVVALGNPLADIELMISEEKLHELELVKNSMTLISKEEREKYLEHFASQPLKYSSGGSVANTLYDLAKKQKDNQENFLNLGLIGFVAEDTLGKSYQEKLQQAGVDFLLKPLKGNQSTGTSMVFITPDGGRTMRTTLGCASELLVEEIDFSFVAQSELIYLEGYLFNSIKNIEVLLKIMKLAEEQEVKLAISCSDAFCVLNELTTFKTILEKVDIFFANYEEALAILGYSRDEKIPLPKVIKEIQKQPFKKDCLVVVTAGSEGSYQIQNNDVVYTPARKVEVIDTTGAGDAFAAGIFYGYFKKFPLEKMGKLATVWASEVIGKLGARVE